MGNTRVVLTDEEQTDAYPVASLESSTLNNEKIYYNIPDDGSTRVNKNTVAGYPADSYTDPNDYIQRLSGSGTKVGTSITLKVMAGDIGEQLIPLLLNISIMIIIVSIYYYI